MATFNPSNVLLQDAKTGEIPSEQGTLVLTDFMQNSAAAQLAKYEPMTKEIKKFDYLAEGPGAYWVAEGDRIETSKATWLQAEMRAHKLGVILPVTKEFLRYSVSDFFTQMRPAIAEAFYKKFDQAALFGNNSPYASGATVWENIQSSGNTLALGSTENMYTDLNSLRALVEDADLDPDAFVTTKRFRHRVRGAVDQAGSPIFNETTQGEPNTLVGLPVAYADGKSWDYDKTHLITGDWDYARYGILQGIEYSISEDATLTTLQDADGNPVNLFERDMFALRATMHVAFMVLKEDAFAALTPQAEG